MYALLIVWATSLSVLLLTRDHPNVLVRSRLTEIQPYLYLSGVLILLDTAGCRIYRHTRGLPPLLPRRTRIFCLLAFSLGLFCFLLYAALTASYSPPDSALPELSFPSAYTHEFSGTALLFCLVLALGLLSLIASFLVSSNHVPALKDILAVLGCLLAPSSASSSSALRNRKHMPRPGGKYGRKQSTIPPMTIWTPFQQSRPPHPSTVKRRHAHHGKALDYPLS